MAINPEKVCFAHADGHFREVVRDANVHICDGIGTALAVRLLWRLRIPRITGVELFHEMLAQADEKGWRVFLLGASGETSREAVRRIEQAYPRLQVAGACDGYFEADGPVVEQINAARTDLLFVALGSPRQERWIAAHRDRLQAPFCMGIGGSLDVLSGRVKRAPSLFRKTGTEWLYRLIREPRRWRRQLVLPWFAWEVLLQRCRRSAEPLTQ